MIDIRKNKVEYININPIYKELSSLKFINDDDKYIRIAYCGSSNIFSIYNLLTREVKEIQVAEEKSV